MSNLMLYALISMGTLVVLFIAGCVYVLVSYSDDDDDDYDDDVGWK